MTTNNYQKSHPAPKKGSFTFIDLFAGIGGMRIGFEAVGGKCVFTSEWDKHSIQTYEKNFDNHHPVRGDIRKITTTDIPRHDVLLAGFPCQPFSLAGVSKKKSLGHVHGFECETQGTLFFDIERIIKHHRPAAFLLENVKNLKSHNKGHTFAKILDVLENNLGYRVRAEVIDARAWVPQHRERIYLVGFREDVSFEFGQIVIPEKNNHPHLSRVLHSEDGTEAPDEPYTTGNLAKVSDRYALPDKLWRYLQAYAEKHKAKGNGFGFGLVGPRDIARTLSARYYKDGSEILVRRGKGENPRRLTPRECARLMGFDKLGLPKFVIPVSDVQSYRQFGNAVVPYVVEALARAMRAHIMKITKRRKISRNTRSTKRKGNV